jgi:hypothetical protein
MDNTNVAMNWWDWDLAIEKEHLLHPKMTQRQLADRLGLSKSKVNNALKILAAMNEYSRGSISENLWVSPYLPDNKNTDTEEEEGADLVQPLDKTPVSKRGQGKKSKKEKPRYRISESILLALTGLEDPWDITDAVDFIILNEFKESMVNKLIEFLIDGGELKDFDPKTASKGKNKGEDPFAEDWKGLHPSIKVKHKGGEDYEIHLAVSGGQKALEIAQGAHRSLEGGLGTKLLKFLSEAGNS